jgi:menaquinone-dependent protoporphyrinogen oxidase
VSLSAGGPGAKPEVARQYVEEFRRRTGWTPAQTACFAGALRYRQYNPFIRLLMRLIVGKAGGETDTTRDHEYTDWDAVERFAQGFAAQLGPTAR